ncbi:MAG: hypothetical protein FOGNACKC_02986 [Anaerolineae bacterium]|nr:hypothetical protein [Anaerolineae bacterium]
MNTENSAELMNHLVYPSPNPLPKFWGGGNIELVRFLAAKPPKISPKKHFSHLCPAGVLLPTGEKGVGGMRGNLPN